jgi:hypothetical protein
MKSPRLTGGGIIYAYKGSSSCLGLDATRDFTLGAAITTGSHFTNSAWARRRSANWPNTPDTTPPN